MNEASFKSIISGERRSLTASLARSLLSLASLPYGLVIRLRNAAFDCAWKRSHRVGVPVISIGNISTGGTGKTPFVAYVVNWFLQHGRRPAILSRGYRSLDGQTNDEKLVLDRLCPGVPHIQNRDRVAGAAIAIQEHQADILVLDDGFQHRRIARDVDIVLVDALNPWGYGRLLPRGLLREPLTGFRRAGLIVLTRADRLTASTRASITAAITQSGARAPIVEVAFPADQIVNQEGSVLPAESSHWRRPAAFCGIGNPEAFRATLSAAGLMVTSLQTFPDHHHYRGHDLTRIGEIAASENADILITTEKDLVKVPTRMIHGIPVCAVRIRTQILAGMEAVDAALTAAMNS